MNMNATSLSINLSTSSSYPSIISPRFQRLQAKPINISCRKPRFCSFQGSKTVNCRKSFVLEATNMDKAEVDSHDEEDKEEGTSSSSSTSVDSENERNSRPRRIALFVEPSPFA